MKNLPKNMLYIGNEIRLVKDLLTQKEKSKVFHVAIDKHTSENYLIDPKTHAIINYKKFPGEKSYQK